jgi:hypothetical protein
MFHCHNLAHEDNDMMRAFEVSGPNQVPGYPDAPLDNGQVNNSQNFNPMSNLFQDQIPKEKKRGKK